MSSESIVRATGTIWELSRNPLCPEEIVFLDWGTVFLHEVGTKEQRANLLKATQDFFNFAIETDPQQVGSTSLHNRFVNLRALLRWMVSRGLWQFSALTCEVMWEFLCSRRGRRGETGLSEKSLEYWFRLFNSLWNCRTGYSCPVQEDPRNLQQDLGKNIRPRAGQLWKALPEESALPLIKASLRWVTDYGDTICNLTDKIGRERLNNGALSKAQQKKRLTALIKKIDLDGEIDGLRNELGMLREPPYFVIRRAVMYLEGACLNASLFIVGFRTAELASLNEDCLIQKRDTAGRPYYAVKGIAAKKNGEARDWVIPDELVPVFKIFEKLYKGARSFSNEKALVLQRRSFQAIAPMNYSTVARLRPTMISFRIRSFAKFAVPNVPLGLHAHMARKTFARFVVTRDKSALEPLSSHYGHAYRTLTDGTYVGHDMELIHLMEEEDRKELAACLTSLLSAPTIAGKAGLLLQEEKKKLGPEKIFRGKKALQSIVDELIARGIQIAPCNWGFCVYAKAFSACNGNDDGPNEENRSPDTCSGCSNFSVTERHRKFWEERLVREEAFLKQSELPEQTRLLVKRRVERSEEILRVLTMAASPSRSLSI